MFGHKICLSPVNQEVLPKRVNMVGYFGQQKTGFQVILESQKPYVESVLVLSG